MRKIFIVLLCSLLASFAFAQLPSVAVMKSLADEDSKISPQELNHLTKELHSIAGAKLPVDRFSLMPIDEVQKTYEKRFGSKDDGSKAYNEDCEEGKCMGRIVDELGFNFGARCDFSTVRKQLYLNCELYGTLEGENQSRSLGRIEPTPIKDFNEAQSLLKKKAPDMFDKITKTPRELCMAEKKIWDNGACKTAEQIAMDKCTKENKVWDNGACKSMDQIACEAEAKSGKKWHGGECKTAEQIACENKGSVWINGTCISQTAPAAVAPATGGNYVAQIVTQPAGASLLLNGAPYQGCLKAPCKVALYQNSFKLSVVMNDYKTKDTTVTITMPNQVINVKLEPKTYNVYFTSEPSGASLTANDDQMSYMGRCQTPCNMSFKKGSVKVSASLGAAHESKDTTIYVSGDNQRVNLRLSLNYGTLDIKGGSYGWNLRIGDRNYTSMEDIGLFPGAYNINLSHDDYEDIDFSVDIIRGENKVFDISDKIVHKYGFLDIKPAYSEGIGKGEGWILTTEGQTFSLGEVRLLHGDHQFKLTHRCYEDITAEAKIGRNETTNFDISDKLVVKQGTLVLRSKRKVRNLRKPVFINGKEVGETPFEGSVPLCSEIKMGKEGSQETVYVKLEHNKPVEYIHRESTWGSHLLGAMLDAAGAGLIGYSLTLFKARDKAYDDYAEINTGYPYNYDDDWEKVDKNHKKGNTFLIVGGAAIALGIGVHIWF